LKEKGEATVRTLVDMEGSYLSANFFREIVAAESFSYDPTRPKPQFVTLAGEPWFGGGWGGVVEHGGGWCCQLQLNVCPAQPTR